MSGTYEERAASHAARRDVEIRLSTLVSRLRLATFIPGALLIVWWLSRGGPGALIVVGAILLCAFAAFVVWHARVEARVAWFDALRTVNLQAAARVRRAWDGLPEADIPRPAGDSADRAAPSTAGPPGETDVTHHPYAIDLDLFGRASLLQWLGPAATAAGGGTLRAWLLGPAVPDVVRARQLAVEELAAAPEWREHLAAHGRMTAAVRAGELARFVDWAEGPGAFSPAALRMLRPAVLGLTAAIWILAALQAAGVVAAAFWLLPTLAGIILSFVTTGRVHGAFDRAGAGQHAFARYSALFEHAVAAPAGAGRLAATRERLAAPGSSAPACMRRLNRIVGFAQLRSGAAILHFPIQALTLWDFHVLFALDTWRRRVGPSVRGWMEALGELDALSAFAQVRHDNPSWCMPELTPGDPVLRAAGLGHPLIPDHRRVVNDVAVGPPGTLLLITGSNMSGKSTLLRAVGLNAVLAQAGAPVCASSFTLPPVDLETSIRVHDSLEQGLSYFMAALARLKGVVDRAERTGAEGRMVLYLLDEILQGTNTAERAVAVRGIARHLLKAGAIGVMTTHDLAVAAEEPLRSAAQLAHFTETVDRAGVMTFDYRLRPGLATSRNALRLMHLIGLDLDPDG